MTRCAVAVAVINELEWCSMDTDAAAKTEVVLLETSLDEEKSVKSAGTVVLLDEKECTNCCWGETCCNEPPAAAAAPLFAAALVLDV